jgi:hypothetical protein
VTGPGLRASGHGRRRLPAGQLTAEADVPYAHSIARTASSWHYFEESLRSVGLTSSNRLDKMVV